MTRTSFHGAWYSGLIVRVVLCRVSASESLEFEEKVDGLAWGVLSIVDMIRDVLLSTESGGQDPQISEKSRWIEIQVLTTSCNHLSR